MGALGPQEWAAIFLSLRVALVAVICALPFAIGVAYLLARKQFFGRQLLNVAVHLPLVMPPVVTGYLLLVLFGSQGPVGRVLEQVLGLSLAFRWTGAALAAAIMAFPLMVRAIRLGLEAIDPGLEDAAATLGASRWRVFGTVTLPLALPSILAGVVLGFAKALGEFGATITFVAAIPGQTQTIPSAIYGLLQVPNSGPAVVGLVTVSIVLAMGALLLSEWLAQRMARKVGR
ncbi:molybdate ABC transporter permease subunit [Loktanella sp. D2R18]|uniref:molybdate ABC transporter permease subunit n=1 Tax=Rhodobacterales TaxID=204455 RepID=UPI000DEBCE29|nr:MULTISPECIES: molybdate ABC transporter permease subunit [Rhodobacterales]MDO6590142.1 molybdate ABC transporter permease subunit [Yoonia sp. 1_MG-2023]RBW45744.1 molybdate ABC transporter permease subunit [Loktanella sp. D2R18]